MHGSPDDLMALRRALRALPTLTPPVSIWPAIASRLPESPRLPDSPRLPASRRRWALAASLLVASLGSGSGLWLLRPMDSTRPPGEVVTQDVGDPAGSGRALSDIARLISRSQQLESLLGAMPERPTVERAAAAVTIDELQQRIQLLDFQLSRSGNGAAGPLDSRQLWNDRVQLLHSLIGVRYAEAARDASQDLQSPGVI